MKIDEAIHHLKHLKHVLGDDATVMAYDRETNERRPVTLVHGEPHKGKPATINLFCYDVSREPTGNPS